MFVFSVNFIDFFVKMNLKKHFAVEVSMKKLSKVPEDTLNRYESNYAVCEKQ